MTNFLVKIKQLSVITVLASLIIGVVLLVRPDEALQIVSLIFGVTIILLGVGSWISYFVKDSSVFLAIMGTLALIMGIIVCVKYKSIITILLMIFGIFLIISGIIDLISALDAKKKGIRGWGVSVAIAAAVIILGLIVAAKPFGSVVLVTRLLGAALLVYAVMDIIAFFQVKKAAALNTVVDKDVTEINITQNDIEN